MPSQRVLYPAEVAVGRVSKQPTGVVGRGPGHRRLGTASVPYVLHGLGLLCRRARRPHARPKALPPSTPTRHAASAEPGRCSGRWSTVADGVVVHPKLG